MAENEYLLEYGELFGDLFTIKNDLGEIAERIDLTEIPSIPKVDDGSAMYEGARRNVERIKNLPTKTFYMYSSGHPKMSSMPVLKKNDRVVALGDTAHSYPRLSLLDSGSDFSPRKIEGGDYWKSKGIPADMHNLVARSFVPNHTPEKRQYVDHINDDNVSHCLEVLNNFEFKVCKLHQCDWRPQNLRWVTNGENVKHSQERKKREERDVAELDLEKIKDFLRVNLDTISPTKLNLIYKILSNKH